MKKKKKKILVRILATLRDGIYNKDIRNIREIQDVPRCAAIRRAKLLKMRNQTPQVFWMTFKTKVGHRHQENRHTEIQDPIRRRSLTARRGSKQS